MDDTVALQLIAFNQLYKELDGLYHRYAKYCGLSDAAFWVIYSVQESEGAYTQKELCAAWSYSKQTVNSALKSLESQGIIELIPVPGNRKNKQIFLTGPGKALAEKTVIPLMEAEKNAFGNMSDKERGEFLRLTKKHMTLLHTQINLLIKSPSEDASSK